jgi:topoisomerase-4 subunit A
VVDAVVVGPEQSLVVLSGTRSMTLSYKELEAYMGQRGARGGLLPRGWQKVEGLLVE